MSELRTGLPHTDFLSPRPEILPKTYTEAEVQAMVAAAVMEAAVWCETHRTQSVSPMAVPEPCDKGFQHEGGKYGVQLRALITPDAMAALEAYRDREVAKALNVAAERAEGWVRRAMHLSPDGYEVERVHGHMAQKAADSIRAMIPQVTK